MSAPVVAFVVGLLVVGCVGAAGMLFASRKGDPSSSRFAFWVVLAVIYVFIGMFATIFLIGWFGGMPD